MYHITITDQRTGNTLVDEETTCIICGINENATSSRVLSVSRCSPLVIIGTIEAAMEAIKSAKDSIKSKAPKGTASVFEDLLKALDEEFNIEPTADGEEG